MRKDGKIAITGAYGFLGWHLSCRLAATRGVEAIRLGRDEFADPERLAEALTNVDTVIHVAGLNRAGSDDEVRAGNIELATRLRDAVSDRRIHLVYVNSIQADRGNGYGEGKRRAGKILADAPGTMADVLLPNLFGEHGLPHYNSFVATFAHEIANGRTPQVHEDRQISLLHAQDAAEILLQAAEDRRDRQWRPTGEEHGVVEVLDRLRGFQAVYPARGEIPDISESFERDLFNTYRAFLFPGMFPLQAHVARDHRGALAETVRSHGGKGQVFISSTDPGTMRGDHYHLKKIERFMVFQGEAEIALRRLYDDKAVQFHIRGDKPVIVDMPTLWVHNIRNVGGGEVITVFWSDQLLDPQNPDQYQYAVGDA